MMETDKNIEMYNVIENIRQENIRLYGEECKECFKYKNYCECNHHNRFIETNKIAKRKRLIKKLKDILTFNF